MSEARADRYANQSAPTLQIYTFGGFKLMMGGKGITFTSGRSRKMWDLFKYFFTMRGKKLSVADCYEAIWSDEEGGTNPSAALHNLIYRLRRTISQISAEQAERDPGGGGADYSGHSQESYIVYSGGCYYWNPDAPYWLDAEAFDTLVEEARATAHTDHKWAIALYQEAIRLYQGEYLPEYVYNSWVIAARNRYSRMFADSCSALAALLRAEGRHEEVAALCENVFTIDPMDDSFHAMFIDALLDLGRVVQAQSHYQYVTSLFYKEMGIKPTSLLKQSYDRIKKFGGLKDADLTQVQIKLNESAAVSGAFSCDIEVFRSIYQLESRRMPRQGYSQFICLASLVRDGELDVEPHEARSALDALVRISIQTLRSGDVVSKWNDDQLVLLLPSITVEDNLKVMRRIEQKFSEHQPDNKIRVRLEYSPIMQL